MARIKKIIAEYNGFHTEYIYTTYYPNGLIDEEEGIEAVQLLTDKGGWTINFTQNGDEYNFANVLEILQKSDFSAIAGMEPEMEVGDSTGVDGQLFLNGEICQSDEEHLIIKGASEIIDNDWDKIGEQDTYEVVVSEGGIPDVEIIFEDESKKNFDNINDAVAFIKNNLQTEPEANREDFILAVENDGAELENVPDDLKNDKEVVMAAVQQNGEVLQYASDELKADKEVVMAAVMQDGWALEYASEELKVDPEILKLIDN